MKILYNIMHGKETIYVESKTVEKKKRKNKTTV